MEFNTPTSRLHQIYRLTALFVVVSALWIRETSSPVVLCGAALIMGAALLPALLWTRLNGAGLPLFPIHALTYVPAFAFPILAPSDLIRQYSPDEQFHGALTVTIFLLIATAVWYSIIRRPHRLPDHCLSVSPSLGSDGVFLLVLVAGTVFIAIVQANALHVSSGVYSVLRAAFYGLTAIATFVLFYRCGRGELSPEHVLILFISFGFQFLALSTSLILASSFGLVCSAVVGLSLGLNRIPVAFVVFLGATLIFLHYGKTEMRGKYWDSPDFDGVSPWEYPSFYREWIRYSAANFVAPADESAETQEVTDRLSLIHLLLLIQDRSPRSVPYLHGRTYEIVPLLLIPRLIYPSKPGTHQGQQILNIHYGLQTERTVKRTFINWGFLNEAFANFAWVGLVGLAILFGALYAYVARWAIGFPLLSFRSLVAILFIRFAADNGMVMSTFITALFQAFVVVTVFCLLVMTPQPLETQRGFGLGRFLALPVRLRFRRQPPPNEPLTQP